MLDGSLNFYYDNAEKLATTSTGIDVTGTINGAGILSNAANFGEGLLISQDAGTGTLSSANRNTGFGYEVFDDLTSGDDNSAFGQQALAKLTTGGTNTAVGSNALEANTTGAS